MQNLRCPCCSSGVTLQVRNSGFVNCEWAMRGILNRNRDSKIYADGRTYDSKLYTFKECDYRHIWFALDIMVKPIDTSNGKAQIRNISPKPDDKAQQKEKRDKIDLALAKEGVPNPHKDSDDEEFSSSVDDDEDDLYIDGNNQ